MNARAFGAGALAALAGGLLTAGCGGSSSSGGGVFGAAPTIQNVNNATEPASPVGLVIEVNGSGFGASPGQVTFTEGANQAAVVPPDSAWADDGVLVVVPPGGSAGDFTVPGSVEVRIVTAAGQSNAVDLELVDVPTFDVNNVSWATTTPLPTPLRGLAASPVPGDGGAAWAVVTGGNDGVANVGSVVVAAIDPDGTLGAWSAEADLPATRAHHGAAMAHAGNSLVPAGSAFVYVVGGQEAQADAPGGVATVYAASVDPSSGAVGAWSTTSALPAPVVGPSVVLFNGYVYAVGGLDTSGDPTDAVYSAEVRSDGSLGSWTTSPNPYPVATSFAAAFGFGGFLYVVDGDPDPSTDPNAQGSQGMARVSFARADDGAVGSWTTTASTAKQRLKHVVWAAFGQVIAAEGIYEGAPGSLELERAVVLASSELDSWNGITATTKQIGANVYNAGALVSPIRPSGGGPRFLLVGGQEFTQTPPGALSDVVHYNTGP